MADLLPYLIGGLANGALYSLLALGFVLVYRATSVVNFAIGSSSSWGPTSPTPSPSSFPSPWPSSPPCPSPSSSGSWWNGASCGPFSAGTWWR